MSSPTRRLLDAVAAAYTQMKTAIAADPAQAQQALRALPDAQFRLAIQVTAQMFSMLKKEAEQRGGLGRVENRNCSAPRNN